MGRRGKAVSAERGCGIYAVSMPMRFAALAILSLGLVQPGARPPGVPATLANAPPASARAPAPAERIERERLVGVIGELPTKRSARADDEHLEGLYKTQEFIVK